MLNINQAVCHNLLLLGLDPQFFQKTHGIKFDSSVLKRVNPKVVETIIYFLLSTCDSKRAQKDFSQCYPSLDKKHERQFRQASCAWINDIRRENADLGLPKNVSYLLMSSSSDKFKDLLLKLCHFVIQKKILATGSEGSRIHMLRCCNIDKQSGPLLNAISSVVKASTITTTEAFTRNLQKFQREHNEVNTFVSDQLSINSDLETSISGKRALIEDLKARQRQPSCAAGDTSNDSNQQNDTRDARIAQLRELHTSIRGYSQHIETLGGCKLIRDVINADSDSGRTVDKYHISYADGAGARNTTNLLWDKLVKECRVEPTHVGNKLNLTGLTQQFNVTLCDALPKTSLSSQQIQANVDGDVAKIKGLIEMQQNKIKAVADISSEASNFLSNLSPSTLPGERKLSELKAHPTIVDVLEAGVEKLVADVETAAGVVDVDGLVAHYSKLLDERLALPDVGITASAGDQQLGAGITTETAQELSKNTGMETAGIGKDKNVETLDTLSKDKESEMVLQQTMGSDDASTLLDMSAGSGLGLEDDSCPRDTLAGGGISSRVLHLFRNSFLSTPAASSSSSTGAGEDVATAAAMASDASRDSVRPSLAGLPDYLLTASSGGLLGPGAGILDARGSLDARFSLSSALTSLDTSGSAGGSSRDVSRNSLLLLAGQTAPDVPDSSPEDTLHHTFADVAEDVFRLGGNYMEDEGDDLTLTLNNEHDTFGSQLHDSTRTTRTDSTSDVKTLPDSGPVMNTQLNPPRPVTNTESDLGPVANTQSDPRPVTNTESDIRPVTNLQSDASPVTNTQADTRLLPNMQPPRTIQPGPSTCIKVAPHSRVVTQTQSHSGTITDPPQKSQLMQNATSTTSLSNFSMSKLLDEADEKFQCPLVGGQSAAASVSVSAGRPGDAGTGVMMREITLHDDIPELDKMGDTPVLPKMKSIFGRTASSSSK